MSYSITANTLAEIVLLGKDALREAPIVSSQDTRVRELTNFSFCIRNPQSRLILPSVINFDLIQAIGESVLMFSPTSELKYYKWLNEDWQYFSDDGVSLYGAYGARVTPFINDVVDKIRQDVTTRQASIPILTNRDSVVKTKNFPCINTINLLVRNGKLECHVYMRSNDFIGKLLYDVFIFTFVQEVIANELNLNIGKYYHTATSMHVYEKDWETLRLIKDIRPVNFSVSYTLDDAFLLANLYQKMVDNSDFSYAMLAKFDPFGGLLMKEHNYHSSGLKYFVANVRNSAWARPYVQHWSDNLV